MTEWNQENPFTPREEDRLKTQRLLDELSQESEEPTGGDVRIGMWAAATRQQIKSSRFGLEPMLDETFAYRRNFAELSGRKDTFEPLDCMRLLLRAVQKQAMLVNHPNVYPKLYDNEESWEALYLGAIDYTELAEDLAIRVVQSNVSERYKSLVFIMNLFQERLGSEPSILDGGCSMNLGLKKLAMHGAYPFHPVDAVFPDVTTPDDPTTNSLNKLLLNPSVIGPSVGVDVLPARDEAAKRWVKSCSFYPSELLRDVQRVKEYDDLSRGNVHPVEFCVGDFTKVDEMDWLKSDNFSHNFNLVTFSTVLHQLTDGQRRAALNTARHFVDPDGLIVVQDFLEIDPGSPNGMRFVKDWHPPFTYKTVIFDPRHSEVVPQELFRWEDARCHRLQLSPTLSGA